MTSRAMPHFLGFTGAGAAIPVVAFFLSQIIGAFPTWLLVTVLCLSPAYVLFAGTAACEPYDVCSLGTLAIAVGVNILIYGVIALTLWFTRTNIRWLRLVLVAAVVAVWVKTWQTWA
jgi:uncharacterized membrane protein